MGGAKTRYLTRAAGKELTLAIKSGLLISVSCSSTSMVFKSTDCPKESAGASSSAVTKKPKGCITLEKRQVSKNDKNHTLNLRLVSPTVAVAELHPGAWAMTQPPKWVLHTHSEADSPLLCARNNLFSSKPEASATATAVFVNSNCGYFDQRFALVAAGAK